MPSLQSRVSSSARANVTCSHAEAGQMCLCRAQTVKTGYKLISSWFYTTPKRVWVKSALFSVGKGGKALWRKWRAIRFLLAVYLLVKHALLPRESVINVCLLRNYLWTTFSSYYEARTCCARPQRKIRALNFSCALRSEVEKNVGAALCASRDAPAFI